jgi:hypothetical protein
MLSRRHGGLPNGVDQCGGIIQLIVVAGSFDDANRTSGERPKTLLLFELFINESLPFVARNARGRGFSSSAIRTTTGVSPSP